MTLNTLGITIHNQTQSRITSCLVFAAGSKVRPSAYRKLTLSEVSLSWKRKYWRCSFKRMEKTCPNMMKTQLIEAPS